MLAGLKAEMLHPRGQGTKACPTPPESRERDKGKEKEQACRDHANSTILLLGALVGKM